MPKNIVKEKILKDKLAYIGLDLEKIPSFLKESEPLNFKPSKSYDDISYKVYRHVNILDIKILITPTDRLTDLNEKYKLALPIATYLDSKNEKNDSYFTTFLKMLNNTSTEEIENFAKEQEILNKKIPCKVKYTNNYIWQVYYSDITKQYFMLVPAKEMQNVALFYLLKQQIALQGTKTKQTIYIPISHLEYSGEILLKSQIADLENYLWYFTKEWPNIYEIQDIKGNLSLKIVGKTIVYDNMKSDYLITLENKENALSFYKLVKALFILSTGLSEEYTFDQKINSKGALDFFYKENEVQYAILPEFLNQQFYSKIERIKQIAIEIKEIEKEMKHLKDKAERQNVDYLAKQKQIATFLECKKSFFGKLKYYFGNRNNQYPKKITYQAKKIEKKTEEMPKSTEFVYEEKENYTIEDLIGIGTKVAEKEKQLRNTQLDKKALELKTINLARKIKNANIYINEINLHKKSIFEFWKFSNKDELPSLNEGEEEENNKNKRQRTFFYEEDIEDLGIKMDELQRRKLSKNETDAIFIAKEVFSILQLLNKTTFDKLSQEQIQKIEEVLLKLKQEYVKNQDSIQAKDFDIFGSMSEDKTKIKELHNTKHREIEKDKYKILNITMQTDITLLVDYLTNALKLIHEAIQKINVPFELPIYIVGQQEMLDLSQLQIGNLSITNAINSIKEGKEVFLFKILVKEEMPLLFYSNIIYYDNFNKTLPLGMDLSSEVFINLEKYQLEKANEKEFQVYKLKDEYEFEIIKVHVVEYE